MAYLQKSDYTLKIAYKHLDAITNQASTASGLSADEVRTNCERFAIAEVKSYLSAKYQMDVEYAKDSEDEPDTRSLRIVEVTIDIALHKLHSTINPNKIPELREKNYNYATEFLRMAQEGKADPQVPVLDSGSVAFHVLSSNRKFRSKPFDDADIIAQHNE